jgi:hypothetical protein
MKRRKFFKGLFGLAGAAVLAPLTPMIKRFALFDGNVDHVMVASDDLIHYSSGSFGDMTMEGSAESYTVSGNVTCFDKEHGNIMNMRGISVSDKHIPRDGRMHSFKCIYDHNSKSITTYVDGKRV